MPVGVTVPETVERAGHVGIVGEPLKITPGEVTTAPV